MGVRSLAMSRKSILFAAFLMSPLLYFPLASYWEHEFDSKCQSSSKIVIHDQQSYRTLQSFALSNVPQNNFFSWQPTGYQLTTETSENRVGVIEETLIFSSNDKEIVSLSNYILPKLAIFDASGFGNGRSCYAERTGDYPTYLWYN